MNDVQVIEPCAMDETVENMTGSRIVKCDDLPEHFLDKFVARMHFGRFGEIKRMDVASNGRHCTVEYATEEGAQRALSEGGSYRGHTFQISLSDQPCWQPTPPNEQVDLSVQKELSAMSRVLPAGVKASTGFEMKQDAQSAMVVSNRLGSPKSFKVRQSSLMANSTTVQREEKRSAPQNADAKNELEAIMKRPGISAEERYRILDARDKYYRLMDMRQVNIAHAKATIGHCPDMCPEKERMLREFQRQIHSYEVPDDYGTSLRFIIKEYSRSSADQESPLPHELRSEAVLNMTMSHLLHNIMDLCNDNVQLGEWFHFVWDRTRSIRKDITQQELCSLGAVKLVEQCARFHIHCAARLVAEGPATFDPKINAENLTKCLQTLKYMYHDLRLKQVGCPNELEFRTYIVLLNLHDSNFLWEVKQLPADLQTAPQMRRAVQFYFALQDNNYARFFRMLREPATSYLSACILLRYFTPLRLRALKIITRSQPWRKNEVHLPLTYFTRVLAFENAKETADFFRHYGFNCDDDRVQIERLEHPGVEFRASRAHELVESKLLNKSIGECVCGEALPPRSDFENYVPHSSFDENGYLRPEAWLANDQLPVGAIPKAPAPKAQDTVWQNNGKPIESIWYGKPKATERPAWQNKMPEDGFFAATEGGKEMPVRKSLFSIHPASEQNANIFTDNGEKALTAQKSLFDNSPAFTKSLFTTRLDAPASTTQQRSFFTQQQPTADSPFKSPFALDNTSKTHPKSLSTPSTFFNDSAAGKSVFESPSKAAPAGPTDIGNLFAPREHEPQSASAHSIFTPKSNGPLFVNHSLLAERRKAEEKAAMLKKSDMLAKAEAEIRARITAEKARFENELRKRKELEKQQRYDKMMECAKKLSEDIIEECVTKKFNRLASIEYQNVLELQSRSAAIAKDIIEAVMREELTAAMKLAKAEKFHANTLLRKSFSQWLDFASYERRQRKMLQSTPLWLTPSEHRDRVDQMTCKGYKDNLSNIRRYRQGNPRELKALLCKPLPKMPREKLDMCQILDGILPRRVNGTHKYFKLLISLPGEREELFGFNSMCERLLKECLHQPQQPADEDCFMNCFENNVALCLRKVTGIKPLNECGQPAQVELENCDGIIFFMAPHCIEQTQQRLQNICRRNAKVAFIVYDAPHTDSRTLSCQLRLSLLGLNAHQFYGCELLKSLFNFSYLFKEAVTFLALESTRSMSELVQQSLSAFLDNQLGLPLWQRWQFAKERNHIFAKAFQNPANIIQLYNEAIRLLQEAINRDFADERVFPTELRRHVPPIVTTDVPHDLPYFDDDWQSNEKRLSLLNFIEHLKLPKLTQLDIAVPVGELDIPLLQGAITEFFVKYAKLCSPGNDTQAAVVANGVMNLFELQMNRADLMHLPMIPRLLYISYISIVECYAHHRMDHCLKQLPHPDSIVYARDVVTNLKHSAWWLKCATSFGDANCGSDIIAQLTQMALDQTVQQVEFDEQIEIALQKAQSLLDKHEDDCSYTPMQSAKQKNLTDQLLNFEAEIERFQKKLALTDDFDYLLNDECGSQSSLSDSSTTEAEPRPASNDAEGAPATESEDVVTRAMRLLDYFDAEEDRLTSAKRHILSASKNDELY